MAIQVNPGSVGAGSAVTPATPLGGEPSTRQDGDSPASLPLSPLNRLVLQGLEQSSRIVATLGPASDAPDTVRALIQEGARVFRLNFSHGSHDEHAARVRVVREVSAELGVHVALLQDLSGPKMRIGQIALPEMTLRGGTEVFLVEEAGRGEVPEGAQAIPIPDLPLHTVKAGHRIFLADGRVVLLVEENRGDTLKTRVVATGVIRPRSGIAFPDSDLALPATTEKDMTDLQFGLSLGVNAVALSFVSNAHDVAPVRQVIDDAKKPIDIISKIERAKALEAFEEILDASDGIMVARGDLGIDIPLEKVPLAQDRLVRRSRESQKPVIVATQMLETMTNEPRPTRAEISDVFLAAKMAADGLMLSGETAIGKFPVEAVSQMRRAAAEGTVSFKDLLARIDDQHHGNRDLVPGVHDIGRAVATAARDPNIVAIAVCTTSGKSARLVSSHRPSPPIFAVTTRQSTAERVNLLWGVTPLLVHQSANSQDEIAAAVEAVRPYVEARLLSSETPPPQKPTVLVVCGTTPGIPGSTSTMQWVELRRE